MGPSANDDRVGNSRILPALIVLGLGSVFYWQQTGDLRLYALVQFYPMIAVPLFLLMSRRRDAALWSMTGLYAVAKILELGDHQIAGFIDIGGHPLKHVAAAGAILCYVGADRWGGFQPARDFSPAVGRTEFPEGPDIVRWSGEVRR